MRRTVRALSLFSCSFACLALSACQRTDEGPPLTGGAASASSAASADVRASLPVAPVTFAMPTEADKAVGEALARQGAQSVAACSSCHGAMGEGQAASGFPQLAGQPYRYLLHQLDSYADGSRANAIMAPVAKAMSEAQRRAAAAHYARLSPAPVSAASAPQSRVQPAAQRGAQLAHAGDDARLIQACVNCHGPGGQGMGASYPYLAGQHSAYLVAALAAWRDGSRRTDPSGLMPLIAKALNEADAHAVADHYAALPAPPSARDTDRRLLAAAPASAAVRSGPTPASQATPAGRDVEQGTPVTGGSQGPGGGGAAGAGSLGGPSTAATASAPASR